MKPTKKLFRSVIAVVPILLVLFLWATVGGRLSGRVSETIYASALAATAATEICVDDGLPDASPEEIAADAAATN